MHPLVAALARRLDFWLDHVAPRGCLLCTATLCPGQSPGLCQGCLLDLPGARAHRCLNCALPTAAPGRWCAGCQADPPPFDLAMTVADYAAPLDRALTTLKFGRQAALARPLGELIALRWQGGFACQGLDEPRLDCLIPIPLGPTRLAQRGFNQSLLLARACANALGKHPAGKTRASAPAVRPRLLRRPRDTEAQSRQLRQSREDNLDGSFVCPADLSGLCIGLVDDIMTTGNTLAEAARVLKRAGASTVVALVVARTALAAH